MKKRTRETRKPERKFLDFFRQPIAPREPAVYRRLGVALLENRLLLAGDMLFEATAPGTLLLRLSGDDVQIVDAGMPTTVLAAKALDDISDGVRIEGNTYRR